MIHIEGQILGPDTLTRIADLPGQRSEDFGMPKHSRLADEIVRAWTDAKDLWRVFRNRMDRHTDPSDYGTSDTRRFWLEPLFSLLGYDPDLQSRSVLVEHERYAISHRDRSPDGIPLHLVGFRHALGHRRRGVERFSPHEMVQDFLNHHEEHLYGLVSNGLVLRLLRDSARLSRQQYIEWDLQQIFEDDRYLDFATLYRCLHATRLRPLPAQYEGATCWMELYHLRSVDEGNRIRDGLRDAVENALRALGEGFLQHRDNGPLRQKIASGALSADAYNRTLRRLVYRLLFLLVAEERELIFPETEKNDEARRRIREIYRRHYSMARFRLLAENRHRCELKAHNLWPELLDTFAIFEQEARGNPFGITPLDGELFDPRALDGLRDAALGNEHLLKALHRLHGFEDKKSNTRIRINYRALDVEELGSVYESLLDLHPYIIGADTAKPVFDYSTATERKTTGSYYTRHDLVAELIRSALEPVMEQRLQQAGKNSSACESALMTLRVCDPACGSGHFLLAAARRLALELARVRTPEGDQPERPVYRQALRDVIEHCIYGVDYNPDAVELCQVALWLEGHNPGNPLSFLQHKIRCGNSLVGVQGLHLLDAELPDEAFNPVTGDDKATATALKKQNREWRKKKQMTLFDPEGAAADANAGQAERSQAFAQVDALHDDTLDARRAKASAYERLRHDKNWLRPLTQCHLYTAAFFQHLRPGERHISAELLAKQRQTILSASADAQLEGRAYGLAEQYRFFHWDLEFPDVAAAGGFDVLLGNPPWERIKLQEKEFFATRDPEIANAPNKAAREQLIKNTETRNPALYAAFRQALHEAEATAKFLRASGRYALTAAGDINTYSIFAELFLRLLRPEGRAGFIVPTGIATDSSNKKYFAHVAEGGQLASLFDFENKNALFPNVHRSFKFCLLTLRGLADPTALAAQFGFFLHEVAQLQDPERVFALTPADFARLNPNTRTCPVFRTRRDAELTARIYERLPVLVNEETGENPWGVSFATMFHMSNDSRLFRTRAEMEAAGFVLKGNRFVRGGELWLPLYEAKMIWHYDHRLSTFIQSRERNEGAYFAEHEDPAALPLPWYWVPHPEVESRLEGKWGRKWFLGFRDIARSTDERTAIFDVFPFGGVSNKLPVLIFDKNDWEPPLLLASKCSMISDFVYRQKIAGTSLNFFYVKQIPVLPPSAYSSHQIIKILSRLLELTYTAWDIKAFADDVWREADEPLRAAICRQWEENKAETGGHAWQIPDWADAYPEIDWAPEQGGGCPLPPFRWDEDRRAFLRAELDALYARLYGLTEEDLRYILDPQDVCGPDFPGETFRVLKDKEERQYGEYRTKRLVLEAWERLKRESPENHG